MYRLAKIPGKRAFSIHTSKTTIWYDPPIPQRRFYMLGKSHHSLGLHLADKYLSGIPNQYRSAFLLGCVQPDRNPLTYLKGSLQYQTLRGHNYENARRFIHRLSRRLEHRRKWNIWDYYSLGKLIHYIADSHTYVHNAFSASGLSFHRCYESQLQPYFLEYLLNTPDVHILWEDRLDTALNQYHVQYCREKPAIHTDVKYIVNACNCVFTLLFIHRTTKPGVLPCTKSLQAAAKRPSPQFS